MKKIIPVLTAALLIWSIPFFAISHEGAHDHEKKDTRKMESQHNMFEEGSGSSVLSEPGPEYGHEYKDESRPDSMKSGHMDEGSSGMMDHRTAPQRTDHEEGSGMKSTDHEPHTERSGHAH
ncbi:hypothetical protein [Nitrospina gracilis]|uniref:hypothetical protein n=1 Tax=Nitrospina gracilis TaxID=35801 RepID=UPI001F2F4F4A|nr:hypothetical protein [Nitrospina gracilis]MCF8720461.1 hypothetical protein [Nitrospina gracilis Nb-211]